MDPCHSQSGVQPLHIAASGGAAEVVALLLAAGADPLAATPNGTLPIHTATSYGHARCLELLLAAAPSSASIRDGTSMPLHHAASAGSADCCAMLIDAGAPLESTFQGKFTPLYCALAGFVSKEAIASSCGDVAVKAARDTVILLMSRGAKLSNVHAAPCFREIPSWVVALDLTLKASQASARAILELHRRQSRVIGSNGRDVLRLVATVVWMSRGDDVWLRGGVFKKLVAAPFFGSPQEEWIPSE